VTSNHAEAGSQHVVDVDQHDRHEIAGGVADEPWAERID
jgi:hypothetical protein